MPGEDFGGPVAPPGWPGFPAVKPDPSELPGVAQDQTVPALPQNQVIVFERNRRRRLDAQLPGHAQMNAQPAAVGEAEEQLFAVRLGTQQRRAAQRFPESREVSPAEDFFAGAQLHGENLPLQTPPPLLAVILNFSQFGHEAA